MQNNNYVLLVEPSQVAREALLREFARYSNDGLKGYSFVPVTNSAEALDVLKRNDRQFSTAIISGGALKEGQDLTDYIRKNHPRTTTIQITTGLEDHPIMRPAKRTDFVVSKTEQGTGLIVDYLREHLVQSARGETAR